MVMTEIVPGEIAVFFNDIDATIIGHHSDLIHSDDLAAMRTLDENNVRRVLVSARQLAKTRVIFRQCGYGDAVLDGGATIILDGVEEEDCRQWLTKEATETLVGTMVTQSLADHIGYNGQSMQPARPTILNSQPAETSPSVAFTYRARSVSREAIRHALHESGLGHLRAEFNPYRGSDELHYVQIGLADKAIGIERYQEITGLRIDQSAGIGDGEADRGIFARSALRFAMGNSVLALLQSGYSYRQVRSIRNRGYSQAARIIVNHNRSRPVRELA
jgi:hydroxymethylpyrimidine pyrophosphatase-like HAD family hydrolase